MAGDLYLVATPIGNIKDITDRAREILQLVDIIYAEDTRETKSLLQLLNIETKKITSYHNYNESNKLQLLMNDLDAGRNVAIVSDRGTPLISDPGYKAVHHLRERNYNIIPIPGPVALISALIASGLPTEKFLFFGFVNYKQKEMEKYRQLPITMIFYESPKRISKLIKYLLNELGDRDVVIAKELTKKFEKFYSGKLTNIQEKILSIKGEFVVLVGPPVQAPMVIESDLNKRISELTNLGIDKKTIEKIIINDFNVKKNEIYQNIHK